MYVEKNYGVHNFCAERVGDGLTSVSSPDMVSVVDWAQITN